jgi:hypothetical protein
MSARARSRKSNPTANVSEFEIRSLHDEPAFRDRQSLGDLRIEGYIGGKMVIEKKMSAKGVDKQFLRRGRRP